MPYKSRAQQAAVAIAKKKTGMAKGKTKCPKCKGAGCSHCGGKGYHTSMSSGYKHGGLVHSTGKMNTGIRGCGDK